MQAGRQAGNLMERVLERRQKLKELREVERKVENIWNKAILM
jgi:hypothetical protein